MSARFTGTEMLLASTALEVIKSLLTMIANKLDNAEGSDIEAMEQVLESMKVAIELEKKIQEAQNEVNNEDVNLDDWISDSGK
jgi:hypothetical protein